ncbi:beta-galactosidase [Tangfeifania diversioriginum]|uniref:Beta-galactosidase n=1 Tax=Tangfeifania diversioriginum TaxID=1168035 RepID=A0A1M6KHU2_9BACT|nr:glycoside hydrolase family 2 TIM barrel-domain containing protein [Tangfeifania diversioriginum]SHJ58528.1 beta-galactosidase [Tangfeifania diversioriginum]
MNYYRLIIGVFVFSFLISCNPKNEQNPRERTRFTTDWKFTRSNSESFFSPDFDDSDWRVLNLPHDWSVEGEFSEEHPASPGGGALPGGIGWYRKTFQLPESDKNKLVFIDFDGIYQKGEVWINGHRLGMRPYGYSSVRYELTQHLNFGDEENVLAVKVDNSEQPNSRWYSGSGIYRNVWLVKTGEIFVDHWGTYVTTPNVSEESATVSVETTLANRLPDISNVTLKTEIYSPDNKLVTETELAQPVGAGEKMVYQQNMKVENPDLWSIENPALYKAVSEVYDEEGNLTDTYKTTFGIRTFRFDPEKGFFLNGEHVKLLGVCNHHDLGCLGAAVNTRAIERQLEILKEMGCNSIRTAHNPPAPELLELCDKMGFVVQDETFDMWRKKKTEYDYSRYFPEWHERDLTDHILRDRNHASVMMWSIGNEVLEQWEHVEADTLNIQKANHLLNFEKNVDESIINSGEMSVNSLLTTKLANIVKELDPTRPVTAGCNEVNPWNNLFQSDALDIYGFNYHHENFAGFPENYPGKAFLVSESTSGLMSRGFYQMPSDSMFIWPDSYPPTGKPYGNEEQQCSSYDNCHVPWGSTHEESWKIVKKYDHIAGTYIWTGFDYLGEPTPYWWPSRSSYFGIIDLAGFPKDIYYMYQSEWTDKDVLHVFPHWNWEPGQTVDIWAYSSAPEVELFLNGESLGSKTKGPEDLHLMWRVPFEPGTLEAVSREDGKVVMEKEITTAGEPEQLKGTPDRKTISADGYDLSYITVEVLDKEGNFVPTAENLVQFSIEGNAEIFGVDNGNPVGHQPLKGKEIDAFNGKCLVVVKADNEPGNVTLTAASEGLDSTSVKIKMN